MALLVSELSSGQNVHLERVDQIVQFALARAAFEEEFEDRELGPIHLIKYVYLADLAFAQSHKGDTYTQIPWKFFHFGPWSSEVNDRLEHAVREIDGNVRPFESEESLKESKRFSVSQNEGIALERRLEPILPPEVTGAVRQAVRNYANDTHGLLNHVYQTLPMLRAAPNEALDFTTAIPEPMPPKEVVPKLSRNQEKNLQAALEVARRAFRERLRQVKERPTSPPKSPPPRFDEVYFENIRALDAEEDVEIRGGRLSFPEDIWKSDWRDPRGGE